MREEQPIRSITEKELVGSAEDYKRRGYRFVQMCCTKLSEDAFELTYSFDKDYKFENLRVTVPKDAKLPSITGAFQGTFLYENEIRELFGIDFEGISVDYRGHMYKKSKKTPFATDTDKAEETCQKG